MSGAGKIGASGTTEKLNINLSGAASLDMKGLVAKNVKIKLSGAGKAKINVLSSLDANISGIGSIEYYGNPETVNRNVSGLGKIVAK